MNLPHFSSTSHCPISTPHFVSRCGLRLLTPSSHEGNHHLRYPRSVEAMTLADRIVVMNAGVIEQIGKPLDLYHRPASLFVARFIGSPTMNTLPASLTHGRLTLLKKSIHLDETFGYGGLDSQVVVGIRPEDLIQCSEEDAWVTGELLVAERWAVRHMAMWRSVTQRCSARSFLERAT